MDKTEAKVEAKIEEGWIHLGSSEFREAKRLQALLEERGVQVALVGDPAKCSAPGCKVTVEVHVRDEDLSKVKEFFLEERNRVYDGLNFDPTLLEEVYDPEKPTARCPACGTEFPTTEKACPDCGLAFG